MRIFVKNMIWNLKTYFLVLSFVTTSGAVAQESGKIKVFYAGLGFISQASDIPQKFEYLCLASAGENSDGCISSHESRFTKVLTDTKSEHLVFTGEDTQEKNAYIMAVAVDRENLNIQKFGDGYSLIFDLSAQIILVNFSDKKVVGTYPIAVRYADFADQNPSKTYIAETFHQMVSNSEFPVSLVSEFKKRVPELRIFRERLNIRFGQMDLSKQASEYLQSQNVDLSAFQRWMGENFSKSLSYEQSMPVLPYVTGDAIGKKMPLKVSNRRESMNLTIPPADYVVNVKLRGLFKRKLGETNKRLAWSYINGLAVTFKHATSNRPPYFEGKFQYGRVKEVPKSLTATDVIGEFEESVISLMNQISTNLTEANRGWLKEHMGKKAKIEKVVKDLKGLETKVLSKVR